VTVRGALLPIGAVLVLGVCVYLFLAVRSVTAPSAASGGDRPRPARAAPAVEARVQQPTAPPNAPTPAAPRPAPRAEVAPPPPRDPPPVAQESLTSSKLEAAMDDANKAYDRGDYEDARQVAGRVLAQDPSNVRMLRVMVSASCIDGDGSVALSYYARLPPVDQEQMRTRCARYGVSFGDK
jgi:type IV secretory pathway VirB10-like protein